MGTADGGGGRFAVRRGMRRRQRQQLGHDRSGWRSEHECQRRRSSHDRRRAGLGHAARQRLDLLNSRSSKRPRRSSGSANSGAQITYGGGGSGKGRTDLTEKTVDFAGSDAPFKDDEKPAEPILYFPILLGPITVSFNVSGVDTLNLSPDTIAGIFQREITKWNDPAIAADNAGADLPDTDITVAHRSDGSGTTQNFTEWLVGCRSRRLDAHAWLDGRVAGRHPGRQRQPGRRPDRAVDRRRDRLRRLLRRRGLRAQRSPR